MKKEIYGYWISKNDIIEVPYESHAETAIEEILKKCPKKFSIYGVMFRLGYVRLVYFSDNSYGVEYYEKAKLSKLQKEFVQDSSSQDVVNYGQWPMSYDW